MAKTDDVSAAAKALGKMAAGTIGVAAGAAEGAIAVPVGLAAVFVGCLIDVVTSGRQDCNQVLARIQAKHALDGVQTLEEAILKAAGMYEEHKTELEALAAAARDPTGARHNQRLLQAMQKLFAQARGPSEDSQELGRKIDRLLGDFSSAQVDLRGADLTGATLYIGAAHADGDADCAGSEPPDPGAYLRTLRERTSHIDIRGLKAPSGEAHRFPIDDLYIPLTTTLGGISGQEARGKRPTASRGDEASPARIELHEALRRDRLAILGDPGSGKTTFLHRIACGLCSSALGVHAKTTAESLGLADRPFPMLISVGELAEHIHGSRPRGKGEPRVKTSPAWLAHFLGAASGAAGDGLDEGFFRTAIQDGPAVLLIDGLDEAPTRRVRESLVELIANAARSFKQCRFVVTSRRPAYVGKTVLPDFGHAVIDPIDKPAIEGFLTHWFAALFPDSQALAREHRDILLKALQVPEIRRMARNPVMLTALAVVHWNQNRLPEQRAELYESIIGWLSESREKRSGRPAAQRCVGLLQELALAMHQHPKGRQVQVPLDWAARQIAPRFRELHKAKRLPRAEAFLGDEQIDSGIVVARGDEVRFWHLTFQEFLAARALAAQSRECDLARADHLHSARWREVVLLLAGVLFKQGREYRVDPFLSAMLDQADADASLPARARCAGLMGAALRDLAPFDYHLDDARYGKVLADAMAIFDAKRSAGIDMAVAIEAAEALGQAGDPRFAEPRPLDNQGNWVTIRAGEFLMGAQDKDPSQPNYDKEAYDDESAVHPVRLEVYRIGRYPVTVGEYARFMEADEYKEETWWSGLGFDKGVQPDDWDEQRECLTRPVVGVSWYEASAYAAWVNCRLPTEAEWERAARGTEGRRYPWGDEPMDPSRANYDEGNVGHATPVGVYPKGATPERICDLAGNVWEWCQDQWHESYDGAPPDGSAWEGGDSSSRRVVRGGSWGSNPGLCRSSFRSDFGPEYRLDHVGFRVVVSLGGVD